MDERSEARIYYVSGLLFSGVRAAAEAAGAGGVQRRGGQVWDAPGSPSLRSARSHQTDGSPAPPAGTCLRLLVLFNVTPLMAPTQ